MSQDNSSKKTLGRPEFSDSPSGGRTTRGGGLEGSLELLADVIESRKLANGGDPDKSYISRLFSKGNDAILKKIGEEATEVVMAAKDGDAKKLTNEVADLWFHCMIALSAFDLRPADVIAELRRREGLSGLEEFALRKAQQRDKDGD